MSTYDADVQRRTLIKLVIFAVALAFAPIATYFLSIRRFFPGNATYAAISAVVVANCVLVGYVTVAFREEQAELNEKKAGKSGGPGKKLE
ncbi:vma21-like-containing protein [Phaffia rhodozyma]|uniref:Vma21-like-containing protein n=1 Tax=Phaffia rhodozyma TaxID=264483 RepID=A0A0F7SI45_PHARH|nr:vma21-like-containing protein [Phaffia rhodozyma]